MDIPVAVLEELASLDDSAFEEWAGRIAFVTRRSPDGDEAMSNFRVRVLDSLRTPYGDVPSRVSHLGALVKDATRPEEVRRRLQMADFEATRDIFAAAGALLRTVEDVHEPLDEIITHGVERYITDELEQAAGKLRAAFDRWIPGWDQPEAGLDLN